MFIFPIKTTCVETPEINLGDYVSKVIQGYTRDTRLEKIGLILITHYILLTSSLV